MNLFFMSYRIRLIFFILITCESCFIRGIAQDGTCFPQPWIQEINLPEYNADLSNQSFFTDEDGSLFLGKNNGLTIFGLNSSHHIPMDGPVHISAETSDTIYYTCENDLGFIFKDKNGKYILRSQIEMISRTIRSFKPKGIICKNGGAFILTDRGIYHNQKGRISYHAIRGSEASFHLINKQLLVWENPDEIFFWNGEEFQAVTEEEEQLQSLLHLPRYLDKIEDYKFLEYISADAALALSKKLGLVIVDVSGNILSMMDHNLLTENEIRQITVKGPDEIWILGNQALFKILYPSALNTLELGKEGFGRIFTSEATPEKLFLGTSQGVVSLEFSTTGGCNTRQIKGTGGQSYYLFSSKENSIYAAGNRQLIEIHDQEAFEIAVGNYTGLLALVNQHVIASGDKGILRYEKDADGWRKISINPELKNAISLVEYQSEVFLICKNEVFRLNDQTEEARHLHFKRDETLQSLFALEGQLFLQSDKGIYRYEQGEETFLPLEDGERARLLQNSRIFLADDKDGHWMLQDQGKFNSLLVRFKSADKITFESRTYPVLKNLGEIINLHYSNNILFLTGKERLIRLDLSLLDQAEARTPFPPLIQSLPGWPGDIKRDAEKNVFTGDRAVFQISDLNFQAFPEPEFRYKLEPESEEWTQWNAYETLIFDRLKPGDYSLLVQMMDLIGRVSDPSKIEFSIKAPFYRSWYAYIFYGLILLTGLFMIRKLRLLSYRLAESRVSQHMQSKLDDLTHEKEKSDKIVADILPDRAAQQIRKGSKAKWDKYERATVLFSDIQGFTKIAEEMNPELLIDELDQFFFHFDSVVDKYNIEKIKTIGDAYMAAGGIPEKNSTNPVEVVLAALEMQNYMQKLKSTKTNIWDLRIGVHTGPVIAGVVGHKKVSYDIWGDTVNTASRMESSGMPGKVNISGITYGMVKDYFICEYRGKLPVKYKGNIDMYFVSGLRPELAVDLKGIPNKRFFTKLQLLRLNDLEDHIFDHILTGFSDKLHFHSIEYARKVYNQSFLLVRAEEIEQENRLFVRTAALMLYTGLTQAYSNFENRSSIIARDILPKFQYSESQIDKICNLIMATKIPFQPINQLEKILIDSKMEYIGRPDYPERIKMLHREMVENGINLNGQQFKKQQLELLYTFDYFTIAARRLREVSGEVQRSRLEQERWI